MTGSFLYRIYSSMQAPQAEPEKVVCYVARSLQAALGFVTGEAHDGDKIVVADQYLAQIVESTAIGLGLNLVVEVDRSLLP